jgi:phosphoribosylformylglycinamidine (FGAM) synthase-like enzyme
MKNDYMGGDVKISIPPTILISVIGKIEDVRKAVTMDLKQEGSLIYILGTTKNELGASEYLASFGMKGTTVPKVDAATSLTRYTNLHHAMGKGLVLSAHDCSDGGLAVCLAEMAFSGAYGLTIDLGKVPAASGMNDTEVMYSESAGRIVIEVGKDKSSEIETIFGRDAACIGMTGKDARLVIKSSSGDTILQEGIDSLKAAWKATLDF